MKTPKSENITSAPTEIVAVDLFCGVGGLTRGLIDSGISVRLGIDIDPQCEFPYTANNEAKFFAEVRRRSIRGRNRTAKNPTARFDCWPGAHLVSHFRLIDKKSVRKTSAGIYTTIFAGWPKNRPPTSLQWKRPQSAETADFARFVKSLEADGYHVSHEVVDCSDFGVPQRRRRLVLMASKLGPIVLIRSEKKHRVTVKQAIGRLPKIAAGGIAPSDRLHQSCTLSDLNMKRIRASKPGGTWRDWDEWLVADCTNGRREKRTQGFMVGWNGTSRRLP